MRRLFDFLRTNDLPLLSRVNFAFERNHYMLWTLALGAIEGNLAAIVAAKTFGASKLLASLVWSAPIVMMVFNIFWGVAIRGRRRIHVLTTLTLCASVLAASIAFASPAWKPWGGWLFLLQIAATHFFVTGLVTLRSSMWQVNYPAASRGSIIGRLQTVRFLFVPLSGAVVARVFDVAPELYRYVYPAAALLGLASLLPLRRFRIRGEKREIREFREHTQTRSHAGLVAGVREAVGILKHDHKFRRYMIAQFTLGSANFFTDPVLVIVIVTQLGFGYLASNLLMAIIPGLCSWIAIGFWAPWFDRVGVLRFRIVNCAVWTGAYVCVAASMLIIGVSGQLLWIAIPILVLGRILKGVAHGGGLIAWSIGHIHFARKHQSDLYMSIHVGLTGLRALVMPGIGLLANQWLGGGSFAIAIFIAATALLLFRRLASDDARSNPDDNQDATPPSATPPAANVS